MKVKIITNSTDFNYSIGDVFNVKYYPGNPDIFYQTIESPEFSPRLIFIPHSEILPDEQIESFRTKDPVGSIINILKEVKLEDRLSVLKKVLLHYNIVNFSIDEETVNSIIAESIKS